MIRSDRAVTKCLAEGKQDSIYCHPWSEGEEGGYEARTAVLSHSGGLEQCVGQLHPCLLLPELLLLSSGASLLCFMGLHDSF